MKDTMSKQTSKTSRKRQIRRGRILNELQLYPQIKVAELSKRLDVSLETIRRDLAALQKEGQLERTFGGAVSSAAAVPGIGERQHLMMDERDRISETAVSLIEPGDVVMVGGGSTTLRLALKMALLDFPVTVITHSVLFAISVGKNKNISVSLLPGLFNPDEGLTYGTSTINAIREFSAHKAFIGTSGVTEQGLYALLEPGEVYKAITETAQKTYVLADSSKYGALALSRYRKWSQDLTIISDALPGDDLAQILDRAGVQIIQS